MRKIERSFGVYRYFIVPNEQMSLFDAVEERRKEAVQNFFFSLAEEKKRSWEIKKRKHLLVYNRQISKTVFICKFSMETKRTVFVESDTDIENLPETEYPFIYVIIDTWRQIVLLELNSSVFSSLDTSKEKLNACFENSFSLYGFEVLFEEVTDSDTFWTFVSNSLGVYELAMTLNSPNLFGGFLNTNEMLKQVRDRYNNSKTTIKLTNNKPTLTNINQENESLRDAVEYASGGGGEWSIKVESLSGQRKTHRSKHNIRKVVIRRIDNEEHQTEVTKEILRTMERVDNIIKEETANEEQD